MTQKKIIALLHARSEQAIQALDESYGRLCRCLARNMLGSGEDAEEVVSDTFLAVWNRIPPDTPVSLKAYVVRILRNLAIKRHERETAAMRDVRMHVCLSELEEILPGGRDPEAVLEGRRVTEIINGYLATLDEVNQAVFVRRYFHMEACATIAKDLALSEQAVHSRLFRMRESLRKELEKEDIFV